MMETATISRGLPKSSAYWTQSWFRKCYMQTATLSSPINQFKWCYLQKTSASMYPYEVNQNACLCSQVDK